MPDAVLAGTSYRGPLLNGKDLEVLRGGVAVDPEPLRDLGDNKPLRVRLEKRPDLAGDGAILVKAHEGMLRLDHIYLDS